MDSTFSFDEPLDANIDLTPIIDTIFLLLIFFIMATTFSKPVLEVALQSASGAAVRQEPEEKLTISITQDGKIIYDEAEIAPEAFDAFMSGRPKTEQMVFNVDKGAPFGAFVLVLDAAKKYGKANFAINATTPAPLPAESNEK